MRTGLLLLSFGIALVGCRLQPASSSTVAESGTGLEDGGIVEEGAGENGGVLEERSAFEISCTKSGGKFFFSNEYAGGQGCRCSESAIVSVQEFENEYYWPMDIPGFETYCQGHARSALPPVACNCGWDETRTHCVVRKGKRLLTWIDVRGGNCGTGRAADFCKTSRRLTSILESAFCTIK